MENIINYFTNDKDEIIREKLDELDNGSTECIENREWPQEEVFKSVLKFLMCHSLENKESDEKTRNLLHRIRMDLSIEDYENTFIFEDILSMLLADKTAKAYLVNAYKYYLHENIEIIADEIDYMRNLSDELLNEEGFTGKNERYIIFSYDMGQSHSDGYIETTINSFDDMVHAIAGGSDTVHLYRNVGSPYLKATVYSPNSLTGVIYILVPASRLEAAMKDKVFKKFYDACNDESMVDLEKTI